MADEYHQKESSTTYEAHVQQAGGEQEIKDRGLFDFLGRKKEEEKPQEEALVSDFEKVQVSEDRPCEKLPVPEKKVEEERPSLHRSTSSSSSSSDEEEVAEGGEKKKKKKKGLKDKIKEKMGEEKTEEKKEEVALEASSECAPEEKKGLLEKIKEKMPGGHPKKAEECPAPATEAYSPDAANEGEPVKEKKGILEKIKEKLPGYHKSEDCTPSQ